MSSVTNGRGQRPSLAQQIDHLDRILDNLSAALQEAVADAVTMAVARVVQAALVEVMTNPELRRRLSAESPITLARTSESRWENITGFVRGCGRCVWAGAVRLWSAVPALIVFFLAAGQNAYQDAKRRLTSVARANWSWFRRRSTVFADLTRSRNDQCGRLCDLFQVVAGDSAAEDDQPRMDGRLDASQRPVTAGAQRALDAFGPAKVLVASLSEVGRPRAASVSSPVRSREGWISRAADWVMDHSSFSWDTHLRASRSMISVEPLLSSAFGPSG
jgi:hypothetical protein